MVPDSADAAAAAAGALPARLRRGAAAGSRCKSSSTFESAWLQAANGACTAIRRSVGSGTFWNKSLLIEDPAGRLARHIFDRAPPTRLHHSSIQHC